MSTVIPFGYGFRESMQVLQQLMEDSNTYLVDIRKSPKTGYAGFNDYELKSQFKDRYVHMIELGNANFKGGPIQIIRPVQGIDRLVKGLNKGYRLILLCGCQSYDTCHRKTAVELLKGTMPNVEVIHPDSIIEDGMAACFSSMQPWAFLLSRGLKGIENWKKSTRYRGPIYIHTGQKVDTECFAGDEIDFDYFYRFGPDVVDTLPRYKKDYPTGVILAKGHLEDVVTESDNPWFFGPYGLILRDVKPIEPIRYPGKLGVFSIPLSVVEQAV